MIFFHYKFLIGYVHLNIDECNQGTFVFFNRSVGMSVQLGSVVGEGVSVGGGGVMVGGGGVMVGGTGVSLG